MPSVEYTQSKGLVQKSSTEASISLQGVLSGQRQQLESLTSASHQLTVADSGKDLLLEKADGQTILLPAVAGVKTDLKLTALRQFTVGTTIDFDAFGRKFKLQVVADGGAVPTGKRIDANGTASATGDRFALEQGAGTAAQAIQVLRDLLGAGAEDFAALANVTVSARAGDAFTVLADSEGSSNNGTVVISEAADLTLTDAPTNGQDVIQNAKGLKIKLTVNLALGTSPTVVIPTDRLDAAAGGNTQGSFVGTVLVTGANVAAAGDVMTIDQTKETIGDHYEFICDGNTTAATWFVSGNAKTAAAVSFA